jgi:hypothetical protein
LCLRIQYSGETLTIGNNILKGSRGIMNSGSAGSNVQLLTAVVASFPKLKLMIRALILSVVHYILKA